ncbi:hypothetical protein TrVE_jg1530 [Triparma verrucosa]|nr:hypothetical protein TrVE_jg1530 [Triparma verrucosa]
MTRLNAKTIVEKDPKTSSVSVTITATAEQTRDAYDRVITDASKSLDIPGFRKGSKIPANVVESVLEKGGRGGKEFLKKQALKQLIASVVEPALQDDPSVDPIGEPALTQSEEILVSLFQPSEEIQLNVKCDVWPEVKWVGGASDGKAYDGLEGSYTRKPFNQQKMDEAIKDLKDRQAKLAPKDGDSPTLEMGDACVVNMVGFLADADGKKGEPLPNAASGDQVDVVMETGKYMSGLVEGLVGASVNDTREIKVTFPPNLRDPALKGKSALFDVTVLSVDTRILPEINDEFANNVRPGMNKDDLLEEVKKAVDAEDAREFVGARNKALETSLAGRIEMVIPETLVKMQAKEKFAVMLTEMRDNGTPDAEIKKLVSPENFEKYVDVSRDGITRDLKASLAVEEIAREENIRVDPQEVEEQLGNIKKEMQAQGESDIDETATRSKIEATLQRNYVMDLLAERAKLEVKYQEEEEFDEGLMNKLMEEQIEREKKLADERVEAVAQAAADEEKK